MASFVERISVIIDTKTDQATSAFKSFRSEVAAADGMGGKFKAGWKNVTSQIGQNIGTFAATAGAALFAFGVKAVQAFEDTAKAAVDLGKATGLGTEMASRWIAVADDFEVSASDLQAVLTKMGKSLDSPAFEMYGVATKNAAGETRAANQIFLDVLETINNTAPMNRAKVGADLLGKSWASVAPLLGKTRKEYEDMLNSVEDGQVITASEAKKAERMRLAQDKLADALGEVTLAVGEQAASLAPLIEGLALAAAASTAFIPNVDGSVVSMEEAAAAAYESGDAIAYLVDKGYSVELATKMMADYVPPIDAVAASQDAANAVADQATAASGRLERAIEGTTDAVDALTDSYDEFMGAIDDEEAYQNVALDLLDLEKTLADIDASVKDGSMTWEEGARRASVAISGTKKDVANYAREVLGVPPERLTNIFALIDQGKLTEAQRLLDLLTRSRTVELLIQATPKGSGGPSSTPPSGGGKGGGNAAEGMTVRGASAPVTINVNVAPGGNLVEAGRQTADALAAFYRNGGPRP